MMARVRYFLPVIVILFAFLVVQALLAMREEPVVTPPEPRIPLVEAITATPTAVTHTVVAQGEVAPLGVIDLIPEVGGRVLEIAPNFREGAFFREGEVLVRIDRDDLERRVVIGKAAVHESELALQTEKAQAEIAREEWQVLGKGEATPLALREPQVQLAQARLESARAQLAQVEKDLERTAILAPFDGRVWMKSIDVGQVLAVGVPIARLARTDRVEVVLPVRDADLAFLDIPLFPSESGSIEGPSVTLRADFAGAPRTWAGQIRRVEGQLDPQTRMVRLVAEGKDPFLPGDGREVPLSPGLFVTADIEGHTVSDVFVLPRAAWYEGTSLLVIDGESRLRMRTPTIERLERETIVVRGGVRAGEQVIVSPMEVAVEGMLVRTEGATP